MPTGCFCAATPGAAAARAPISARTSARGRRRRWYPRAARSGTLKACGSELMRKMESYRQRVSEPKVPQDPPYIDARPPSVIHELKRGSSAGPRLRSVALLELPRSSGLTGLGGWRRPRPSRPAPVTTAPGRTHPARVTGRASIGLRVRDGADGFPRELPESTLRLSPRPPSRGQSSLAILNEASRSSASRQARNSSSWSRARSSSPARTWV